MQLVPSNQSKKVDTADGDHSFQPRIPISSKQQSPLASDGVVAMVSFKVGDVVWCKLKGHPIWPAKVKDISGKNNQQFTIVWFKDYRISKVHRNQLSSFENVPKNQLSQKNYKQQAAFKEAFLYFTATKF